ncbi:MAG: Putative ABC transporter permease protein [Anaerolineaceae bacterium 46_22]|nr:MAG: Putative ABC transporter permease protein [Anaerolineaceae bacterium 46_22]
MKPRWRKILADMGSNLPRFVLVILSLAVGMFAVGMITGGYVLTMEDMQAGYDSIQSADIRITTEDFDENLVERVRRLDGVTAADGEKQLQVQMLNGDGEWKNLVIKVLPEDGQKINKIDLLSGQMPVGEEILIDIHRDIALETGDSLLIQLPSGTERELTITGQVRDQTIGTTGNTYFVSPSYGYIPFDTLLYLEQEMTYDTLLVRVDPALSEDEVKTLSDEIVGNVEQSGLDVSSITILDSGSHPNLGYVEAIGGLLAVLGFLTVFLSGFLVFNSMSALFAQQVQYIGIMKAIGAKKSDIIKMYMVLILVFGLIALVISVPLSAWASSKLGDFLGMRLNFLSGGMRYVPLVVILQIVIALILPQAAGIIPILKTSNISVQEAITTTGIDAGDVGTRWIDRLLQKIKGLSRPMLVSLRNTFRRKGRFILTLITLSLGGAVFISTFNVRASLESYTYQVSRYILADVSIDFDRHYRIDEIERMAMSVDGVAGVEPRGRAITQLLNEDGEAAESVEMTGAPPESDLIEPIMMKGRWILPGDRNAIVLNEAFAVRYPDLDVGDTITLYVNRREVDWTIVGFFQFLGTDSFNAYVPLDYLNEITGHYGQAINFQIIASPEISRAGMQEDLARRLDDFFRTEGYALKSSTATDEIWGNATEGLDTLTTFLLIMSGLTALVGSISLAGTMGMNVMERTRETGVMRAIGATDWQVMRLVIVEGLIIGVLSWFFGSLLAFPISYLMSYIVNSSIFGVAGEFIFDVSGFLIWLGMVLLLSLLASIIPANNAAKLTIREVLAYE